MTPEQLISILNLIAIAGWLSLMFLPRIRWATSVVPHPFMVPVLVLTYLLGPGGLLLHLLIRAFAPNSRRDTSPSSE